MTNKKLLIIGILFIANSLTSQQTPAKDQSKSVLIVGATAHIGNGSVIEKSFIGFKNGIINLVTSEYELDNSNYDTIINVPIINNFFIVIILINRFTIKFFLNFYCRPSKWTRI